MVLMPVEFAPYTQRWWDYQLCTPNIEMNSSHRLGPYFEWFYFHFLTDDGSAINLVLHEIGHWMQDLGQADRVCQESGLIAPAENLLADIDCENLAGVAFPATARAIRAVRELLRKKERRNWLKRA